MHSINNVKCRYSLFSLTLSIVQQCLKHLNIILMYVPRILYSLFRCMYSASCAIYFDVRTMHFGQFILTYVPRILYSLLSKPTNAQKNIYIYIYILAGQ